MDQVEIPPVSAEIRAFFGRFSSDSKQLIAALAPWLERELRRFAPNAPLCKAGDPPSCAWLIRKGTVGVWCDGQRIQQRQAGELVGEQAFLAANDSASGPMVGVRTADLIAQDDVEVWCIPDRAWQALDPETRVLWFEVLARSLSHKLGQATDLRAGLRANLRVRDDVLGKLVPERGLAAIWAAITRDGDVKRFYDKRNALIWFSDLAGFSAYAAPLTPERIAEVVNDLLSIQVAAIGGAGGQIDKVMGDGLMAWWPDEAGITTTITARAIGAALAALTEHKKYVGAHDLPIGLRIGLNYGEVALGNFGGGGRIAYTALGEAVNTGARFEQAHHDTTGLALKPVRISRSVWELARGDAAVVQRFDREPRQFIAKHGETFEVWSGE